MKYKSGEEPEFGDTVQAEDGKQYEVFVLRLKSNAIDPDSCSSGRLCLDNPSEFELVRRA